MKIRLISYTKPHTDTFTEDYRDLSKLIDSPADLVAFCARVSNPQNQINKETSEKLLGYLLRNKHWSPFQMVDITLEIESTRDIIRQILRHRSFEFQEFCLSGDTEIYFGIPRQLKRGSYRRTTKIKLSDLYDKWTNGAKPIPSRYDSEKDVKISLKNRLRDMHIKCYDDNTKMLTTAHIKDVFKTGVKPIFEVVMADGKRIKTTKEHKFLTKNGFFSLEEIVGLEMVSNRAVMNVKNPIIAVNGIPCYRDRDWLIEKKQESLFKGGGIPWIANTYGINYNTLRKWIRIHGLQYTKKEVARTVDVWNKGKFGYSTGTRTREVRLKMRESALARGSNHNWYRGGNSKKREPLNGVDVKDFRAKNKNTCAECGAKSGVLDIHHIVPVSVDPTLQHNVDNWKLLCRECHKELHRKIDMTGWQNISAKNRVKNAYVPKWVAIRGITYLGEEETYDIEVDHTSHNYIANGIIVHNSQRYADPTSMDFEIREARLQDTKNRQNSIETDDKKLQDAWNVQQEIVQIQAINTYKWALENGIAKEVARSVLPEGMTTSRIYMKGSLRSWIHYIELRSDNGTQKEHREIAIECANVISAIFPMIKDFVSNN